MAIELHHLHPGHDDEVSRLKARIAKLETNLSEIQSQKMQLEDDVALLRHKLEEERRWRKFPEKDRRTLTKEDYEMAKRTLPTLPDGWYRERHEWDASRRMVSRAPRMGRFQMVR